MGIFDWLIEPVGEPMTTGKYLWLVVVTFDIIWSDEVYVRADTEDMAKAAANRVARHRHPFSSFVTRSVKRLETESPQ